MIGLFENDTVQDILDIIEDTWDDAMRFIEEEDHACACGALRIYFDGIEELHSRGYYCYIDNGETKVISMSDLF